MLFAFLGNPSGCCKLEGGRREEEHVGSVLLSFLPSWWGRGAPVRPGRNPGNVDLGGTPWPRTQLDSSVCSSATT